MSVTILTIKNCYFTLYYFFLLGIHLDETLKTKRPRGIELKCFNIHERSIRLVNNSAMPADISDWVLRIVNKYSTELLFFTFGKDTRLSGKQEMALWSSTSICSLNQPPTDIIIQNDDDHKDNAEEFVWLLNRNDLDCILYDEHMNVNLNLTCSYINDNKLI